MKRLITNYTFNAVGQSVTFTDFVSISLPSVLLIVDVTVNTVIYNFASLGKGGSTVGNVLDLEYDTSDLADTDELLIIYDDTSKDSVFEDILDELVQIASQQLPNDHKVDVSNDFIFVKADELPLPMGAATEATLQKVIDTIEDTSFNTFSLRYDDTGTYTYIGEAKPGTAEGDGDWRIKRLTNADNTIVWASGSANFAERWVNRASLVYS